MFRIIEEGYCARSKPGARWQMPPLAGLVLVFATALVAGVQSAPVYAAGWDSWLQKQGGKIYEDTKKAIQDYSQSSEKSGDASKEQDAAKAKSQQQQPLVQSADAPRYDKPWVTEIQTHLTSLGYNPGPADGAFGTKSRMAITAFQQQRGDQVTGLPTPSVMQALRGASQAALSNPDPGIDNPSPSAGEQTVTTASGSSTASVTSAPTSAAAKPAANSDTVQSVSDTGPAGRLYDYCRAIRGGSHPPSVCECVVNYVVISSKDYPKYPEELNLRAYGYGVRACKSSDTSAASPVAAPTTPAVSGASAASPAAAPASPAPPAASSQKSSVTQWSLPPLPASHAGSQHQYEKAYRYCLSREKGTNPNYEEICQCRMNEVVNYLKKNPTHSFRATAKYVFMGCED